MKNNQRLYKIIKYVVATDAEDAIRKEGKIKVHDVFIEEGSMREAVTETLTGLKKEIDIGFRVSKGV